MPLDLPTDGRTTAFRALIEYLKADPTLAAVVDPQPIAWKSWEGREGTEDEALKPGPDVCPWVRLTPSADDASILATGTYSMPILITIEIATHGLDVADSFNLWGAIERALIAAEAEDVLAPSGIRCIEVIKPCFGIPDPTDQDVEMIVPEPGQIRLDYYPEFET